MASTDLNWKTGDGVEIIARSWPAENAVGQIVLIHGIGEHSGRFEHVANWFNEHHWSVLAPDLRGNGRSGGQRGYVPHFENLLDDIQDAARRAAERLDVPTVLYGQSMGGLLCLTTAMKRDLNIVGVIATAPALRIAMKVPAWKLAIARTIGTIFPKFSLPTGLDLQQLTDDDAVLEKFRVDPLRHKTITARLFFGMRDAGHWCLDHVSELSVSSLLIHGDADQITACSGSQDFAKAAGDQCTLRCIAGGMHELHNQLDTTEFFSSLETWLETTPPLPRGDTGGS